MSEWHPSGTSQKTATMTASNSTSGITAATTTRTGRERTQFVGPGEHIVLRTADADAMFVWRKFIDDAIPKQEGVNCAVFRNEAPHRYKSSQLIRQADAIADKCWPSERHYTYVRAEAVRTEIPGYCFKRAGWKRAGTTRGGLLIFARRARPLTSTMGTKS